LLIKAFIGRENCLKLFRAVFYTPMFSNIHAFRIYSSSYILFDDPRNQTYQLWHMRSRASLIAHCVTEGTIEGIHKTCLEADIIINLTIYLVLVMKRQFICYEATVREAKWRVITAHLLLLLLLSFH